MKKIKFNLAALLFSTVFNFGYSQEFNLNTSIENINKESEKMYSIVHNKLPDDAVANFYQELKNASTGDGFKDILARNLGDDDGLKYILSLSKATEEFEKMRANNVTGEQISMANPSRSDVDRAPCGDGHNQEAYDDCIELCEVAYERESREAAKSAVGVGVASAGGASYLIGLGGGTPASLAGAVVAGAIGIYAGTLEWALTMDEVQRTHKVCIRTCKRMYCGEKSNELEGEGGGGPGGGYQTTSTPK